MQRQLRLRCASPSLQTPKRSRCLRNVTVLAGSAEASALTLPVSAAASQAELMQCAAYGWKDGWI